MVNDKVNNFIKSTKGYLTKHSPQILTGIGVAGMITSTVLAVKATPKALQLIEEAKGDEEKIAIKTMIQVAWKPYIPAVVTGVASISCIIGASAVNAKRNAALTAAYALSERTLVRYRDKVIETIGEKKEKEIKEKIAQDTINENPVSSSQVIITSKGNTLCMDSITKRYFKSDIDIIKKCVNELNREMLVNNYVSLNELYHALGLEHISNGDYLGWNVDDGLIDIDFGTCLAEDEPCLVLEYRTAPKYDFNKFA